MSGESIPRRVYNFFQRYWLLSALIAALPGWFSIAVRLKGTQLGIIGAAGSLTTVGEILFWGIPGISFVFAAAKFGADKYDSDAKIDGHILLQKLMDGVNSVTRAKLERFESYIKDHAGAPSSVSPFETITQPKQQLDKILENLQITLSQVAGINREVVSPFVWKLKMAHSPGC